MDHFRRQPRHRLELQRTFNNDGIRYSDGRTKDEAKRVKLIEHIKEIAKTRGHLEILEAGCGTRWSLQLGDVDFTLTGLDIDEDALKIRKDVLKDLDVTILGDLRAVDLEAGK